MNLFMLEREENEDISPFIQRVKQEARYAECNKLPMEDIVSLIVCSGCKIPELIKRWGMQNDLSLDTIIKDTGLHQRTANMISEQQKNKKSAGASVSANLVQGSRGGRGGGGHRGGGRWKKNGRGGQQGRGGYYGQQDPSYSANQGNQGGQYNPQSYPNQNGQGGSYSQNYGQAARGHGNQNNLGGGGAPRFQGVQGNRGNFRARGRGTMMQRGGMMRPGMTQQHEYGEQKGEGKSHCFRCQGSLDYVHGVGLGNMTVPLPWYAHTAEVPI